MPKLGLTMTQGQVVKWFAQDGERVKASQPLVVVMSKKITYEIESPASGVLRIVTPAKETRQVTEVIGFILKPGETMPEIEGLTPPREMEDAATTSKGQTVASPAASAAPRAVRSSPAARRLARELGVHITRVQGTRREGRITEKDVQRTYEAEWHSALQPSQGEGEAQATPLARRMAGEEGLDLAQVTGTGTDGRITEDDVLRILKGHILRPRSGCRLSRVEGQERTAALPKVMPFTPMRQAIAEGMLASLHTMAQLTLTAKADVTALVSLRDALCTRWDARISYTDLIVKAVATALRDHPLLNSTLMGQEIVLHDEIHIGVAVALEGGLIVPVVRAADVKSVLQVHHEVQDLAERARAGTLTVDEVTGSTFTITNLGMYGIETFTPIINPPEAAILGVGRISEELTLVRGQVVPRSKMTLSLTIDHRIVDGAPGAAFLQTLTQFLEHPALIFATPKPKAEGEHNE
jgi:pyruvate dehydrogenase E2 component (dihydrolipoamide acetyltransferase)